MARKFRPIFRLVTLFTANFYSGSRSRIEKTSRSGTIFFSIICNFESRFLNTYAFLNICPTHSDLGRGKPFFEHRAFVI